MNYIFPTITNIHQILPAIKDHVEFIVKDDPTTDTLIVNYAFQTSKTFLHPHSYADTNDALNAALRTECRGLTFDRTNGNLLVRKYHKFQNVGEKPEYGSGVIPWHTPHHILEKLDGSMATFFIRKDGTKEYHTKMGATPVTPPINKFAQTTSIPYEKFNQRLWDDGFTAIYEWCSPLQRIVLNYSTSTLILTAIRNNLTGQYIGYEDMVETANTNNIPVVKALDSRVEDVQTFLRESADIVDQEGYVIRFADGGMCKIKGNWYCDIHHTMSGLTMEKNVWNVILSDQLDDAKPKMPPELQEAAERFADDFVIALNNTADRLKCFVDNNRNLDRKAFAQLVKQQDKMELSLLFNIYSGGDPLVVLKDFLLKNISTQIRIDEIRGLVNGLDWRNYFAG